MRTFKHMPKNVTPQTQSLKYHPPETNLKRGSSNATPWDEILQLTLSKCSPPMRPLCIIPEMHPGPYSLRSSPNARWLLHFFWRGAHLFLFAPCNNESACIKSRQGPDKENNATGKSRTRKTEQWRGKPGQESQSNGVDPDKESIAMG